MRKIFSGNINKTLLLLFISLVFVLWGRFIIKEFKVNSYIKNLTDVSSRINCISAFGWEADTKSEVHEILNIPSEFDDVYNEYNKLQKMCGLNLEKYKGKSVDKYTYIVLNFPYEIKENVYVNILVYDNNLIGGDCMSRSLDGFILPIDRRFAP